MVADNDPDLLVLERQWSSASRTSLGNGNDSQYCYYFFLLCPPPLLRKPFTRFLYSTRLGCYCTVETETIRVGFRIGRFRMCWIREMVASKHT